MSHILTQFHLLCLYKPHLFHRRPAGSGMREVWTADCRWIDAATNNVRKVYFTLCFFNIRIKIVLAYRQTLSV